MPRPDARIAYLTNQYPAISHTFIRREIAAVERSGVTVDRFALRGWDMTLVDSEDTVEQAKTRYILKGGVAALLPAVLRTITSRPGAFFQAAKTAFRMSRNGVRPWPYHLVYLAEACQLKLWLDETGATHLHAHFGTNAAEIACLVRLLGGPPYSFTIHGRGEADGGARLHFPTKVANAEFVAAISDYTRSQLLREIPPSEWSKVKVVHCGLTPDNVPDPPPPLPESPRFLTIGRLSPEKAHLILPDAFASLRTNVPDARLIIAGDGDMRGPVEERITELGLDDAVTMLGWVDGDGVRRALADCTALVQPSLIEGLPVVLMEAMGAARPVISTYIAGIPELVLPGETGWLVPAGNTEALTAALESAATASETDLKAMGKAGQARVSARHNADSEAQKLLNLIFGKDL